jgi:hypothetical protein
MLIIDRETFDALQFDFDASLATYRAAMAAHALTVGVPKPVSNPYVEAAYERGGYQIREKPPAPNKDITDADIKAEARSRILTVFPDWRQANMTARGVELQDIWRRKGTWTQQEQAEADALQAAWDWIKSVRAASDTIEAMQPLPGDYRDDRHWPATYGRAPQ